MSTKTKRLTCKGDKPKPAKKAKVYKAIINNNHGWPFWRLNVNGCGVMSNIYTSQKSAIRGLRRFAATLGIAAEIEVRK